MEMTEALQRNFEASDALCNFPCMSKCSRGFDLAEICRGGVVLSDCCCRCAQIHDCVPPTTWHEHCFARCLNRHSCKFFR